MEEKRCSYPQTMQSLTRRRTVYLVLDLEHNGDHELVQMCWKQMGEKILEQTTNVIVAGATRYLFPPEEIQLQVTLDMVRDQGVPLLTAFAQLERTLIPISFYRHRLVLVGHGIKGDLSTLRRAWTRWVMQQGTVSSGGRYPFETSLGILENAPYYCLADRGRRLGFWKDRLGQPRAPKLGEMAHTLLGDTHDPREPHCAKRDVERTSRLLQHTLLLDQAEQDHMDKQMRALLETLPPLEQDAEE
jgi:hypothetical protein